MNASRNLEIAKVLFRNVPELVKSEESVTKLIMGDVVDFNTGMKLIDGIRNKATSLEADGDTVTADGVGSEEVPESGIAFPTKYEEVIIKSVFELASDDDKATFDKLLDQLNLAFETAYRKRKADITRVIARVVEVSAADADTATKIMEEIKKDNLVFIKK